MELKILFITSCCFSDSESNGKTMESLFSCFQKEQLAQFYIKDFEPDWAFCDNYFRVTDKDMLKCFFKASGGIMDVTKSQKNNEETHHAKPTKNAFRLLIRQLLWNLNIWEIRTKYKDWVKSIAPDLIFFMVGENSFMMKIAINTSRWTKAPLLVYNTEGYYYAQHNYFPSSSFLGKLTFKIFLKQYRKVFQKLMYRTNYALYNCQKLADDYGKEFKLPSTVLYTTSSINIKPYQPYNDSAHLRISYIGTLGLGRHKSLIQIGKVLYEYHSDLVIHVYGSCKKEVAQELQEAPGIKYEGHIPFNQVIKEIEKSDILVHVESFDSLYSDMIKYGFTTKIADSLMAGRCFFIYAPSFVACFDYIQSINPECTACNMAEMEAKLIRLIEDKKLRMDCASKNKTFALQNHSIIRNEVIIKNVVSKIINNDTHS